MAKLMYPYSVTSIQEKGQEQEQEEQEQAFWTVLGGRDRYARNHGKPRLFIVTTSSDGSIDATEVFDFNQTDLSDRRVAVLDCDGSIFIWVGKRPKKNDKTKAEALAKIYLEVAADGCWFSIYFCSILLFYKSAE